MPYFRGQALGDDQLQATLAQYRQQNPGADLSDQNVLNVLEGRSQPTWETRGPQGGVGVPGGVLDSTGRPMQGGGPQFPPGVAPPGGQMPQPGQWNPMASGGGHPIPPGGAFGGMTPLSAMGRGFGGGGMGAVGGLFGGIFGGGGGRGGGMPQLPRPGTGLFDRGRYEQNWQQGLIPGSPGYEASVQANPNIDPQTGQPWRATDQGGWGQKKTTVSDMYPAGGGLDPYGRVPFDPTFGQPPPAGGFPGYRQLHGQAGQMTPLSQMASGGWPSPGYRGY